MMENYVCTTFGVSKECYGGRNRKLAGTGQGNVVSGNICQDSSCLILKSIENRKLGVAIKSPFNKEEVQQLAVAFVDDNDFISDGEKVVEK